MAAMFQTGGLSVPLSLNHLGISSTALDMARGTTKCSGPTPYQQRFAQFQAARGASLLEGRSAPSTSNGMSGASSAPGTGSGSPAAAGAARNTGAAAAPALAFAQPQACQLRSVLSLPNARVALPARACGEVSSSMTLVSGSVPLEVSWSRPGTTSAHMLQHLDFGAIADSSTGGGGLPRPYGRFVAEKGGDGTAMWCRLPLTDKRAAALQHLFPSRDASSGGAAPQMPAGSRSTSPSKQESRQQAPQMVILNPVTGRKETVHCPIPSSSSRPPFPGSRPGSQRHSSTAGSRAVSTEAAAGASHGSDAVPSNNGQGWFQLPSATFLTQMPVGAVPTRVRVDQGFTSGHDHLRSSGVLDAGECALQQPMIGAQCGQAEFEGVYVRPRYRQSKHAAVGRGSFPSEQLLPATVR